MAWNKLNQKGMGLIGVLVAAALVVTIALIVGNFVSDQNKQNVKLEVSGSCQNIANSIVEYIKKDESSLFISSHGPAPGTTRFANGLDKTDDGLDRYSFGGQPTPLFMGPAGFKMSLSNSKKNLPPNWKYFNHLNIKNSTNRLLALAADGDFCCASLNMNDPNCGAKFLDNKLTRPGLKMLEKDVQVDLAVNFKNNNGSSMCAGRRLLLGNLPDSSYSQVTDFKVRVTMLGAGQGKSCVGSGSVSQTVDTSPSLTLIEMQDQPALCGSKGGLPSHCNSASPVTFKVKTVKDTAGTNCQSQCLAQIQSTTCNALGPINLFNSFSQTICVNNCQESEPGSAFLCKIGEKNWFTNNPDHWQPCELTQVYDWNGAPAGNVRIQYNPVYNDTRSEITTNATITLSNLTEGRAYVVDVRAVDTRGNVGPSFCSTNPNSCALAANPHFVVIPGSPTLGTLTELSNHVGPTTKINQVGRDTTLTSQLRYASALNPFSGKQYQCQAGAPVFSIPISYPVPAGAFSGFITTTCTASLQNPSGTLSIPSGSGSPGCLCSNGACEAKLPASTASGAYAFNMTVRNDCSGAGTPVGQSWCTDNNTSIGIASSGDQVFGATPNFEGFVNYPTSSSKACELVSLCPNVSGGFTPTIGPCPNTSLGWNPMQHSGCLQDPNNNYCMLVMDPCGRSQPSSAVKYSTALQAVPYTSISTPQNSCFDFGGTPVGGNFCPSGSYCGTNGKCLTGCATGPCPTNASYPAALNCGPRYCPTLNSCNNNIGTPSSVIACSGQPPSLPPVAGPPSTPPPSGCDPSLKPNCVIFACGGNALNCKHAPVCSGGVWKCEAFGK